jgi:iron(III) transport system substrate-binding protein
MQDAFTRRDALAFVSLAGVMALATPTHAATAIDIATYKGADRDAQILAGARRDGKVVIYSGMIENQALRPLADAFKKKYPFVTVEYWRGDSRALMLKALTERRANRIIGDIFESTGGAEALIRAGAVQPFASPPAAGLPQTYTDPKGMWVASRLDFFGTAYNTRQVSAAEVPSRSSR